MFKLLLLASFAAVNGHSRDKIITEVPEPVTSTGGLSTIFPVSSTESEHPTEEPYTVYPLPTNGPVPYTKAPEPIPSHRSETPAPSTPSLLHFQLLLSSSLFYYYDNPKTQYYFCKEQDPEYFTNMTIDDVPLVYSKFVNFDKSQSEVILKTITENGADAPLLPVLA